MFGVVLKEEIITELSRLWVAQVVAFVLQVCVVCVRGCMLCECGHVHL